MSGRLRFLRRPGGAIGVTILLFVVAVAVFGPLVAPHSPTQPIGSAACRAEQQRAVGDRLFGARCAQPGPVRRALGAGPGGGGDRAGLPVGPVDRAGRGLQPIAGRSRADANRGRDARVSAAVVFAGA